MMILLFAIISTVMVSGLLLGSIGTDAFATKDDNNGKAKGCVNSNNDKQKVQNPHCDSSNPTSPCDPDTNGLIDFAEFEATGDHSSFEVASPGLLQLLFDDSDQDDSGYIEVNNSSEINAINQWMTQNNLDLC